MSQTFDPTELTRFTGTENWYRHALNRNVLFTDGAKYIADTAGAHWLLDEIALIQPFDKRVALGLFQVWTLTVEADGSATLICEDGNDKVVYTKRLPYTDFPAQSVTLWFTDNVILLPSEY
jgi:hypothetical protein